MGFFSRSDEDLMVDQVFFHEVTYSMHRKSYQIMILIRSRQYIDTAALVLHHCLGGQSSRFSLEYSSFPGLKEFCLAPTVTPGLVGFYIQAIYCDVSDSTYQSPTESCRTQRIPEESSGLHYDFDDFEL